MFKGPQCLVFFQHKWQIYRKFGIIIMPQVSFGSGNKTSWVKVKAGIADFVVVVGWLVWFGCFVWLLLFLQWNTILKMEIINTYFMNRRLNVACKSR